MFSVWSFWKRHRFLQQACLNSTLFYYHDIPLFPSMSSTRPTVQIYHLHFVLTLWKSLIHQRGGIYIYYLPFLCFSFVLILLFLYVVLTFWSFENPFYGVTPFTFIIIFLFFAQLGFSSQGSYNSTSPSLRLLLFLIQRKSTCSHLLNHRCFLSTPLRERNIFYYNADILLPLPVYIYFMSFFCFLSY